MLRRFCYKCGAVESEDNPIINGLCLNCLLKERELVTVKANQKIVVCPVCGSYLVGSSWYPGSEDPEETIRWLAERIIEQSISPARPAEGVNLVDVGVRKVRGGKYFADVTVEVEVAGRKVRQALSVPLNVEKRVCPKCLMKSGGDYEATLQIRSERGYVTQAELRNAGELFSKVNSGEDVVDLIDKKEGLDVILASKEVAKKAARLMRFNMGAKVIESYSVVGMRRDGKVRKRLTLSVRLPAIEPGDGLLVDKEPAILTSIGKGKFRVHLLHQGKELSIDVDHWWSMRKSGRIAYLHEKSLETAEVVESNPLKVRLHGKEVFAEGPIGLSVGEEVYVVNYKGRVYALPKRAQ